MSRYELLDEMDLPFPLGGCFGYWGYDLKNFIEPRLPRRAVNDLELPDCQVGFYDSLVVFDHRLGKTLIISTGLNAMVRAAKTGRRSNWNFGRLNLQWRNAGSRPETHGTQIGLRSSATRRRHSVPIFPALNLFPPSSARSEYIRAGDIYQVNLSQRLDGAMRPVRLGIFSED